MRNNTNFLKSSAIQNPIHEELAFIKNKCQQRFQMEERNPQLHQSPTSKTERPKMETYLSTGINNYSDIFCRNKRKMFSGYKTYNMNGSKLVKFNYNKTLIQGYKTQRKYEENLKNIMKLRKKFSLQPIELRTPTKMSRDYHKSDLLSTKKQLSLEELITNTLPQKQVKQIIRDMEKQHFFYLDVQSQQNNFKTCSLKEESEEDFQPKFDNLAVPNTTAQQRILNRSVNKACFFKSKEAVRQVKRKGKIQSILNFKSHDKLNSTLSIDKQREFNLCGWSFYGNDKLEDIKDKSRRNNN